MFARKKNHTLGKTLFFVGGALAGAAAALLFAPTTGKKLQKQIKNVVDDQVDNVNKLVRKVANT